MKFNHINLRLTVPEILERAGAEDTVEDKIKVLRLCDSKDLQWFVYTLYNWDWTKFTTPAHKPSTHPIGAAPMSWHNATLRMNAAKKLLDSAPKRAENQIALVLENVSAVEYQLLLSMLQNKKQIQGLHKSVFKKMYPTFFRTETDVPSN